MHCGPLLPDDNVSETVLTHYLYLNISCFWHFCESFLKGIKATPENCFSPPLLPSLTILHLVAVRRGDELCRCSDRDWPGLSNYPENPRSEKWSSLLMPDSLGYWSRRQGQGQTDREGGGKTEGDYKENWVHLGEMDGQIAISERQQQRDIGKGCRGIV